MNIYGEYRAIGLDNARHAAADANACARFTAKPPHLIRDLGVLQRELGDATTKNMVGDAILQFGDALDENIFPIADDAEEYLTECEVEIGEAALKAHLSPLLLNPKTGMYERVNLTDPQHMAAE